MAASARIDELRKRYEENQRRFFAPLANEYRKGGELELAIAICRQHLADAPANLNGQIVFGQALFDAGNLDEARAAFETAIGLDPENLIALRHLGDIGRAQQDVPRARQWYERLLDADRRNAEVIEIMKELSVAPVQAVEAEPATVEIAPVALPPVPKASAPPPDEPPAPAAWLDFESAPAAAAEPEPAEAELAEPELAEPELAEPEPAEPEPAFEMPYLDEPQASEPPLVSVEDLFADPPDAQGAAEPAAPLELEPVERFDPEATLQLTPVDLEAIRPAEPPAALSPDDAVIEAALGFGDASDFAEEPSSPESAFGFDIDLSAAGHIAPVSADPADDESFAFGEIELGDDTPFGAGAGEEMAPTFELIADDVVAEAGAGADDDFDAPAPAEFHVGVEPTTEPAPPSVVDTFELADASVFEDAPEPEPAPVEAVVEPVVEAAVEAEVEPVVEPVAESPVEPVAEPTPAYAAPVQTEAFATETMAELYARQGLRNEAIRVYRQLIEARPGDLSLRARLYVLESEGGPAAAQASARGFFASLAGRRATPAASRTPVSATPVRASTPVVSATPVRASTPVVSATPVAAVPAVEVDTQPTGSTGASAPFTTEGELDVLLADAPAAGASEADQVAADTLAAAFSEPPPVTGRAARAADDEISLDHVFGDSSRTSTSGLGVPRRSSSLRFDQFFTPSDPEPAQRPAPPPEAADDDEQFQAWLSGLKKP